MIELVSRSDGPSRSQLVVSGVAGGAIAGVATLTRLAIRSRRGRLWWDDGLALLSLLFLVVTMIAGKLQYTISTDESSTIPQHTRVSLYYTIAVTFDITIWLSRLSVLLNIMRLSPYQRMLKAAAAMFTLALLVLIAQVIWVCEPQNKVNHWKDEQNPTCELGRAVVITQITTDFAADTILVVVPLMLLRALMVTEETKAMRTRLAASFLVGGMSTIISIVHTVYLFQGNLVSLVISNVEMAVSVMICNFIVLAAALHKLWDKCHPLPPRDETGMSEPQFAPRSMTSTDIRPSQEEGQTSQVTISEFGTKSETSQDPSTVGTRTLATREGATVKELEEHADEKL